MKKMVTRRSIIIILNFLLFVPIPAFAYSPQVANGVSWVANNQNADGSWGSSDSSVLNTTALLDALRTLNESGSTFSNGISWLSLQSITATDILSRKMTSLSSSGIDLTSDLSLLVNAKKSDGSWGGDDEATSMIIDTALALSALKAANYTDTSVLSQAVSYLASNQNSDGGWGYVPSTSSGQALGDESNVYVTSVVLRALSSYNSLFLLQDYVNKASSYLPTKQNSDGGFASSTNSGQGSSNVYETALATISLIESGQGSTGTIQNAVSYLTSTQSSNGSWNDDPYSTALALQALAAARPNLTITSITESDSMPREGVDTTITATVKNAGFDNASNIVVRFYLGDPSAGGTQIGTDQVIPVLTPGLSAQVSINQSFTGTGGKTIYVSADPDNLISETSEGDNTSSDHIWVATEPDLTIYSEDLVPSTYVPNTNTAFTLDYTVRNLGESSIDAFTVTLYDGDPSTGSGQVLQTINISGLLGAEIRTGSVGVTLTTNGSHTLYLVADSGSAVSESNETNNYGTVTIQVGAAQQYADIAAVSLQLTPSRPTANETVAITGIITNQGYQDSGSFIVELFDGDPASGGTLIESQAISSLASGASYTVSASWTITSGIHDIYLVADRTSQLSETDESNNQTSIRIMPDMIDITVSATDMTFTPEHPVSGDTVVLSVTLHNEGIKETGAFNFALYDGDPNSGGTLVNTYAVNSIQGDGQTTLSHTFTTEPWTYRFYAIADAENVVTELYEDNNQAIRSLKIKAPGEILGPDLVPTKIDLTGASTDPLTLAISGTASVTFQNKGDDKITSSFSVILFEDTDLDSAYTSGYDNMISSGTNTLSLWPEGAGVVNLTISGTVKFVNSPLYAYVDSTDSIREQDETNNLLNSCADCEKRPSNPIELVKNWSWNGHAIYMPPVITNLTDDNGDGNIDSSDVPTIAFTTPVPYRDGKTWILRGDTGASVRTIEDTLHPFQQNTYVSAGDINNDGIPELILPRKCDSGCEISASGCGLLAFDYEGHLVFDNKDSISLWEAAHPYTVTIDGCSSPIAVDIDTDGSPEFISGTSIFNNDGTVRSALNRYAEYAGSSNTVTKGRGDYSISHYASVAADIDLDGIPEIVTGNAVYTNQGVLKWWNTSVPDGLAALGNFDDDAYPEIVSLSNWDKTWIFLLEHDGTVKWGPIRLKEIDPAMSSTVQLTAPVIADFDGDGEIEIGVKGINDYWIFDKNGQLKMQLNAPGNGNISGGPPMAFDLNGDGRPEIIVNGNDYLRIFDGTTSAKLYEEAFGSSSYMQSVIVADVNNDGHAEVVAFGGRSDGENLRVYGSKNHDWVDARSVWNQHSYHITNVNDNGTIPQYESPNWLLNNTYRTQARIGESPNPYLSPNLTVSYLRAEQNGSALTLTVRAGNGGAKEAAPGATVSFYSGSSSGTLLGTVYTTMTLQPGQYEDITFSIGSGYAGISTITAVVDQSNTVSECREDDNQVSLSLTSSSGMPDLAIGSEDITLPSEPYYEGSYVTLTANVSNAGYYAATNISVRLYDGNPAAGGSQIGSTQTISSIDAGASATTAFSYDTLGKAGTHVLYVVVDNENSILETSETNNSASVTIEIEQPVLPDLSITSSDISLSATSLVEGDQLTVSATILNRGAAVSGIPVRISVRSSEFGVGSESYSQTQSIYPALSLGQTATVQATFETAGLAGTQTVLVEVDPDNTISESVETDNSASTTVIIQSSGIATALSIDKAQYNADTNVQVNYTIKNKNAQLWTGTGTVNIEDISGTLLATAATFSVQNLQPLGLSDWSYRIPATVTASHAIRDGLAQASIDFGAALTSLGVPNATIEKNSIRVLELDEAGAVLGEKQVRTIFSSDTNAQVYWLLDNVTAQGAARNFAVYFDTTDNGQKTPPAKAKFPPIDKLIAVADDYGRIYTIVSNGSGTFGSATLVKDLTGNIDYTRGIAVDDFNNDGYSDIITGIGNNTGSLYYFQNKGDGSNSFVDPVQIGSISATDWLMGMAAGDFNKDGNGDFAVSGNNTILYLFSGNGQGGFSSTILASPTASGNLRGKAAADLDNDGNIDLVVWGNGAVYFYKGSGTGTFLSPTKIADVGSDAYGVVVGDFDEDLNRDIIVQAGNSTNIYILKGKGDGTFNAPELVSSLIATSYAALTVGDFNEDGHLDILTATYNQKTVNFYPGNGDGTFGGKTNIAVTTYDTLAVSASPALAEVHPVLGTPETVPGQTYQFTWNTGATTPGQYQVHVTLTEGSGTIADNKASFEILPDTRAAASVVVDKITYNPNQTATITSTITSQSANYIFENMTATVGVRREAAGETIYTETKTITTLMPGGTYSFKTYWNTGTYAPGTYPVTIEVKDSSGTVIASGSRELTIADSASPSTLLKGEVSVDKQSLMSGETLTANYSVTNTGNKDLSDAVFTIRTVQVKDSTEYASLVTQATLSMGGSYSNAGVIDTALYPATDYLVVLTASIAGVEETLAGTYFRVEGAPTAASLAAPAEGSDAETFTPGLTVNNASDPNDDKISYEFEIYSDMALSHLVLSSGMISETTGTTAWQPTSDLTENATYYWRARAYDGKLYGPWMNTASFRVNTLNDPPTAPVLTSPADNTSVSVLNPLLSITNATDPDSASMTYNFEISLDPEFTQIVTSTDGVLEGSASSTGSGGITSWQVPVNLQENGWYYWRAQADDWMIPGPWSAAASFFVNTANDAPGSPVITSPVDNTNVSSLTPAVVIANTTDPDSTGLTYFIELDTVNTFDSGNVIRSGAIPEGQGTTLWTASGLLDNTKYYIRAKASDGAAGSAWSPVVTFLANTANDAPSVPVIANPSNGSAVNVYNPVLTVRNSTDPDQDTLTYDFEVYSDAAMTNLVAAEFGVRSSELGVTAWTVPVVLTENQTYYWRARAFDGTAPSGWTAAASFMINTANDAPGSPEIVSPAQGGSIETLTPVLSIKNATDPDSDTLTYDFEIYTSGALVQSAYGITGDASGITSITLASLTDNTNYEWRSRASDGDRYSAWTAMAGFTVHLPQTAITVEVEIEPETLERKSSGKWIKAEIEFPKGYCAKDVDISSIRLEGTVPAEARPFELKHHDDHDDDHHSCDDELKVKFRRSDVLAVLPADSECATIHVTGTIGGTPFEGIDIIRIRTDGSRGKCGK